MSAVKELIIIGIKGEETSYRVQPGFTLPTDYAQFIKFKTLDNDEILIQFTVIGKIRVVYY